VTATAANGCSRNIQVTCTVRKPGRVELTVPSEVDVVAGNELNITVKVFDQDDSPLPNQPVSLYTQDLLGTILGTQDLRVTTDANGEATARLSSATTWSEWPYYQLFTGSTLVIADAGGVVDQKSVEFKPVGCNDGEPNNYMRDAKQLGALNAACQGSLQGEPQGREGEDYYKFVLTATSHVAIYLRDIPSGANYDLRSGVYNESVMGRSLNPDNADEVLLHQALPAGEYFIGIRNERAAAPHTYTLSVIVGPAE